MKPVPEFLVIYPGLLMTDFFLYWVGKKYGRMVVKHKRFRRMIFPDRLLKLEEKFKKRDVILMISIAGWFVFKHFKDKKGGNIES
jgi:membrane protein DedA with SNARE-associated domain